MLHNAAYLFINPEEKRFRAFLRIIFQFYLFFVAFYISLIPLVDEKYEYVNVLSEELIFLFLGAASIWLAARFFDRREFHSIGLDFKGLGLRKFAVGFLLGAVIFSAVFLIELAAGWITIEKVFYSATGFNFTIELLGRFIGYSCVGILEELFARGYQMKNFAEGFYWGSISKRRAVILSLIVTSIIFSVLHGANPNASLISILNITLIGFLFGYAFLATGSLAFPIGLHIAWNFFQGNIFGYPVSGYPSYVSVIRPIQNGPEFWTGGAFGPEAGMIIFIGILSMFVLMILIHKKNIFNNIPIENFAEYEKRK